MQKLIRSQWLPLAGVSAVVLLLPLVVPSTYHLRVASLVFVFGLAALGLNLLMGYAGQVSLGHAGFMGIGAYSVALGPTYFGVPGPLAAGAGVLVSCILAYLIGRPILKLRGYYLAIATLGCGLLIYMVFTNEAQWSGGPNGILVPAVEVVGDALLNPTGWYWITGGALILGTLLAINLLDSSTGRALRAIHDSEVAARVAGVDVAKQKLRVFVISAAYASVAGSLLGLVNGLITPDSTSSFLLSVELVTMVVLGGMGSIFGSLVGAAIMVVLPQALSVFHDYEHIILGLIMMLCVILLRSGVVPTLSAKLRGEAE